MSNINPKIARKDIARVVEATLGLGCRKATVFLNPKLIVRATRRHKYDGRDKNCEVILTIGAPNYREREFVRACLKAGEPFPVKKVQLKWYPKRTK